MAAMATLTTTAGRATATATSSRRLGAALAALALGAAAAGCGTSAAATGPAHQALGLLAPRAAPAGWTRASLPDGAAVLAYPPAMRKLAGDAGTVSAAQQTSSGAFLTFLNATPRQGGESLHGWPQFRLQHLLDDDASAARRLGAASGIKFLGGTGSCVMDTYVTKVKANHFTEIACYVQGRTSGSVIVAAAAAARWARYAGVLRQALAAYVAR